MCVWSVFFALVLNVEIERSLSMGTPDNPVRTRHDTVYCSVRATSTDRWGSKQLTVDVVCPCGTPDSPVAHRTVRCYLTSQTVPDLLTHQTAMAVDRWQIRPLLVGSLDSSVNLS
jgi:hypothetical protein